MLIVLKKQQACLKPDQMALGTLKDLEYGEKTENFETVPLYAVLEFSM